ncbi:zinc-dependent alcohol dehydrogenase family protein [Deltaproteobacteria bacterium TL4]
MKAMVLENPQPIDVFPLKLRDIPVPEPKPGEILVKVRVCAICRTDLHVVEGELQPVVPFIIPGHQVVGVVEQNGAGCSRFSVGDRVGIAWLNSTCQVCEYCTHQQENLCEHSTYTGWHVHGGYAEYCVAPESFVYAIPAIFTDQQAAPLLCAGIIGYRALKRSALCPGDKLGVYGFGASAHIAIQVAQYWQCEVYVVTRNPEHQLLAREMGARWAGEDADQLPSSVNSAIIFAPSGELIPIALKHLVKGGTLALAGIYMTPTPSMEYEACLFYEKNIKSVTANTRADGEALLKVAAKIPVIAQTTAFPLEKANEALQMLKNKGIQGAGILEIGIGGPE